MQNALRKTQITSRNSSLLMKNPIRASTSKNVWLKSEKNIFLLILLNLTERSKMKTLTTKMWTVTSMQQRKKMTKMIKITTRMMRTSTTMQKALHIRSSRRKNLRENIATRTLKDKRKEASIEMKKAIMMMSMMLRMIMTRRMMKMITETTINQLADTKNQ